MIEGTQRTGECGADSRHGATKAYTLTQLLLVLGALAIGFWNWDGSHRYVMGLMNSLGGELNIPFEKGLFPGRLTREQRFLLEGDTSRAKRYEQQRAIWEAHPENRVYLGNYITALVAFGGPEDSLSLEFYRGELAAARKIEPDNARFDFLEASRLMDTAATIDIENAGKDETGKPKHEYALEVHDRDQLDQAMALVRQGLGKPYMRRYADDMLQERLAVLGTPLRFVDLVQRTALAASTLLPDLAKFKMLSRASRLYAGLLISEGKNDQAAPYLDAWRTIARDLAEDSFTLIDLLVVNAIIKEAETSVPPLYRQIGQEPEAERVAAYAALIAKPVSDWRERRAQTEKTKPPSAEQVANEKALVERAGVLAAMLLPALGTWPDVREYEAGRMLEYTVFTEVLVAAIIGLLLAVMFVSFLLALRWRRSDASSAPISLGALLDMWTILRILLIGVVFPLVVFFLVTRCLPWSGHHFSVRVAMPKLMAEFGVLTMWLAVMPILMTLSHVNRRCREFGVAVTHWHPRYLSGPLGVVGVLLLAAAWILPPATGNAGQNLAWAGLGCLVASLVSGMLIGFAQGLAGQRQYGAFYGATFRALVPTLALVIIVLGAGTRSFLLHSEARYIVHDTLMYDRDRVGFTRVENDLVEQLRTAMLANFEKVAPRR